MNQCNCLNNASIGQYPKVMGIIYLTSHTPECPHFNDSLIDVWKVTVDGVSCYCDNETDANSTAAEDSNTTVEHMKMHREVLDQIPEFKGF